MSNEVDTHFRSALDLLHAGRLDESITEWHETLRRDPNCVDAHYNLGVTLQQKGDLPAAIRKHQEALELSPTHVDARHSLAIALTNLGDLDAAVRNIEELIRIAPKHACAYTALGTILLRRADQQKRRIDWTAAQGAYETSLLLTPEDSDALYGLGITLWHFGYRAEAAERVQSAVNADPTNERAFSLLYWMQWRLFWQNLRAGQGKPAGHLLKGIFHQRRLPHPATKGAPTFRL